LNSQNTTAKLTLETFLQWKKRKLKEKKDAKDKEEEKKRINFKAGHHIGVRIKIENRFREFCCYARFMELNIVRFLQLSGREMFTFNPELAKDDAYDDGDEVFDSYSKNEEEEDDTQVFKDLMKISWKT
jgi:hypothetical protein